MINKQKIESIVEPFLQDSDIFLVDITVSSGNDIEIIIDKDSGYLTIDECAGLNKAVQAELEKIVEQEPDFNYSLTVGSAGIGLAFMNLRQYKKNIGKMVELVKLSGEKITGELTAADADSVTVSYTVKEKVEGKRCRVEVQKTETFEMDKVKSVKELLTIK